MRIYQVTTLRERERLLELIEAHVGLEFWIADLERLVLKEVRLLQYLRDNNDSELQSTLLDLISRQLLRKPWPKDPNSIMYYSFKIAFFREAYKRGYEFSPTFRSASEWVEDLSREHREAKSKRKAAQRAWLLKLA